MLTQGWILWEQQRNTKETVETLAIAHHRTNPAETEHEDLCKLGSHSRELERKFPYDRVLEISRWPLPQAYNHCTHHSRLLAPS